MNFRYVPLQDKKTSIIFIDIEDLIANQQLLFKFNIHINEMHMRCFNIDLNALGTGLFVFATTHYAEFNTKEDIVQYFLIDSPEFISSMAILYQNENSGQLWSVCSTIEGQTRKLAKLIIQQCQVVLENIDLFVDYFNPYWDRAVGLYISLGFKIPRDVLWNNQERLRLTWDKFDINEDSPDDNPKTIMETCNQIKMDWSIEKGYNVSLLRFTKVHLNIFKQILGKNREYGGGLGVRAKGLPFGLQVLPFWSLNGIFDLVSLNTFFLGNYIIQPNKIETFTGDNMMYSFHTHPTSASNMNRLAISCPSTVDLELILRAFKKRNYKHFVIEPDGIWTIQVDPRSMELAMHINQTDYPIINAKYDELYFALQNDLDKEVPEISIYKNTLINNYLANINNVTWKSLGLKENNNPIMLVNFYPWSFIKNQIDSIEYWTDWTVYKPLAGLPILQGRNDLILNFDFDKFDPILEAIDHVGGLNITNDETLMNTFTDANFDKADNWNKRDLLEFMKRYNDNTLITKIYNGEI
jgi:hypothetical protein